MVITARGSCGNYFTQAELTLRRTSTPPSSPPPQIPSSQTAVAPAGIKLGAVNFDIKPGTEIGRTYPVTWLRPCLMTPNPVRHRQEADAVPDAVISNMEFERVMNAAGYTVRGREAPQSQARYLVLGTVTSMDLNYCIGANSSTGEGVGSVTVGWTVVSLSSGLTVYENTVLGVVRLASGNHSRDGMREVFAVAYRDAVRRLARDGNFRKATTGVATPPSATGTNEEEPLGIKSAPRLAGGITAHIKSILPSVVEIKHPHGSGAAFVVDARGYLLTNAHIVGDATSVNVRFQGGELVEASVLRRDPLHDVALLKVERTGLRPIPIRTGRLKLTEKAYAIGNPQGLPQTITDGVVSAYRELPENGQEYIQVAIIIGAGNSGGPLLDASGNVVGIAASGRAGGALRVNFFVPIEQALARLNVNLGG